MTPFLQFSNAASEIQSSPFCRSGLDQTGDRHAVRDRISNSADYASQRARTFPCPEPSSSAQFLRKCTLRERLKSHTGEKPFQCDFELCGRRFSTSGNMSRHRRLHTLTQFECPAKGCTRVYTKQEKLMKHYRIHLGSAAYPCNMPGCSKSFATAGNLTRHTRKHHYRHHPGGSDSSARTSAWPECASGSSDEECSVNATIHQQPGPVERHAIHRVHYESDHLWLSPIAARQIPYDMFLDRDLRELLMCLFDGEAVRTIPLFKSAHNCSSSSQ